jgi:hypothetical protein
MGPKKVRQRLAPAALPKKNHAATRPHAGCVQSQPGLSMTQGTPWGASASLRSISSSSSRRCFAVRWTATLGT